MKPPEQLRLVDPHPAGTESARLQAVADAFDPARLTQARRLAGLTKRAVADELGVSPAAVGQWETGTTPRLDHLARVAEVLGVSPGFLAAGRPYARLDAAAAHFRSLRSTPAAQRAKAIAFTEQVWELTHALEKRIQLPPVDLPGFSGGEVDAGAVPADPAAAARLLRDHWKLGREPIPHLVRLMEAHGLIVTLVPFAGRETAKVDAFSTSQLPRPVVVLTPDRADDVYRHRFTAAHELGHLLLHHDSNPGDPVQEKEAHAFAAELLTPRETVVPQLPTRMDLHALDGLSRKWGVGVDSLIYRCREVNVISDAAYRRAFQRLNQLRQLGLFRRESVEGYPGEVPVLLRRAFQLAEEHGLTMRELAEELHLPLPRLRLLLGDDDPRPELRLV